MFIWFIDFSLFTIILLTDYIANRLTQHSEVKEVFYLGLSNHPHYALAKK